MRVQKRRQQMVAAVCTLSMYHHELHMNISERRVLAESSYQWVTRTLDHRTQCYIIFRIRKECFDKLHSVLQSSYGLKSSSKMTSTKALGCSYGCVYLNNQLGKLTTGSLVHCTQLVESLTRCWLLCAN